MVIDLISQELSLATFSGALLGTGFSGIEMRMVFTSVEVPATPPVVIPLAILFTSPGADYVTATGQAIGPMGMPNGRVHVELEVKGTAGDVALGALICLVQ